MYRIDEAELTFSWMFVGWNCLRISVLYVGYGTLDRKMQTPLI